jgi:dTDP-4-dehydrorhamnose 3,5-epimerase-like enzyme
MVESEGPPRLQSIRGFSGPKGSLSVLESQQDIPFQVERVYYIYNVPGGAVRGLHAHKLLQQFFVAVSGSFNVTLDSGAEKRSYLLDSPTEGLLVPPGFWREIHDFSSDAVCLVLASHLYSEHDYIRNYDEFVAWIGAQNS